MPDTYNPVPVDGGRTSVVSSPHSFFGDIAITKLKVESSTVTEAIVQIVSPRGSIRATYGSTDTVFSSGGILNGKLTFLAFQGSTVFEDPDAVAGFAVFDNTSLPTPTFIPFTDSEGLLTGATASLIALFAFFGGTITDIANGFFWLSLFTEIVPISPAGVVGTPSDLDVIGGPITVLPVAQFLGPNTYEYAIVYESDSDSVFVGKTLLGGTPELVYEIDGIPDLSASRAILRTDKKTGLIYVLITGEDSSGSPPVGISTFYEIDPNGTLLQSFAIPSSDTFTTVLTYGFDVLGGQIVTVGIGVIGNLDTDTTFTLSTEVFWIIDTKTLTGLSDFAFMLDPIVITNDGGTLPGGAFEYLIGNVTILGGLSAGNSRAVTKGDPRITAVNKNRVQGDDQSVVSISRS